MSGSALLSIGTYLVAPLLLGFAATAVATRPLIGWLKGNQYGKAIREDGPDHAAKSGTPTMGGLAALAVIAIGAVAAAWLTGEWAMLLVVLAGMSGFAVLGLADDLAGLARRSGSSELGVGLTARRMFAAQLIVAMLATWLLWLTLGTYTELLPALVVGAVVIVGTVNGVNMSDGLDGLAAGLAAIAFGSLGLVSAMLAGYESVSGMHLGPEFVTHEAAVALLCFVICGACLGFLIYNRHPARVFMGNVTSMALGGGLALAALASGLGMILLPIIGVVFVAEVVSVIVQVAYFKASGGKRVFRMAPLHHHFEIGGMPETTVVRRFWAAGLAAGLVGVLIAASFATSF